ncbi:hypothetical protein ACK1NN_004700 [Salmonella enterica]
MSERVSDLSGQLRRLSVR